MNVASRFHSYPSYTTQASPRDIKASAPVAQPIAPAGTSVEPTAAAPTDTVELTGGAAVPTTTTTPAPTATTAVTPDEPVDAPGAADEPPAKARGHARVAQNIEAKVERLIARESRRIDRLQAKLGTGEEAASSIEGLKASLGDALRGLADAYTADPSAPSGVLADIRAAVRSFRSDARDALTAPAPAPEAPSEPATPEAPAIPNNEVVPVDEPVIPAPTDEPVTANLFAARVASAYTGSKLTDSRLRLVA